jgi:hypothetical protein
METGTATSIVTLHPMPVHCVLACFLVRVHVVTPPVFTPTSGAAVEVSMATTTAAFMCYRTDGTDPDCSGDRCLVGSTQYVSPLYPTATLRAASCDGRTSGRTAVISSSFSPGSYFCTCGALVCALMCQWGGRVEWGCGVCWHTFRACVS